MAPLLIEVPMFGKTINEFVTRPEWNTNATIVECEVDYE
jgi:hypothetical protein